MDGRLETEKHIATVGDLLTLVNVELIMRSVNHDKSKLLPPEAEVFEKYTPLLKGITYGSDKYMAIMKEMKVAIDHHHSVNSHHPEHFSNGIQGMTLIDLLELICDWRAACMRHADGDIMKSLEINKKRFNMSDDLVAILTNTAKWLNAQKIKVPAN